MQDKSWAVGQSCVERKERFMGVIFWIVLLVLPVYGLVLYNSLINTKNAVSEAWANIGVLLKQRHEALPKLVDTCKHYMQYEKSMHDLV